MSDTLLLTKVSLPILRNIVVAREKVLKQLREGVQDKQYGWMITPAPWMCRRRSRRVATVLEFTLTGRGAIEALPFPDETFDAVTSSLMMHHILSMHGTS